MAVLRRGLVVALVLANASLGCTQTPRPLKGRIPKPDPAQYRFVQDAKDWKNPYLVVGRDGIEILGITEVGHAIAVASIRGELESLPDSAWPYGLVVAVQENGIISDGDQSKIEANRRELVRLLKKLGVTVDLWPSG